jgi:hypothetical protein
VIAAALEKTTVLGGYPEIASNRLVDGHDAPVDWIGGMEFLESLAIVPEQTRFGSHPQKPFRILEQARYRQVGQSLIFPVVLEDKALGCRARGEGKQHCHCHGHGAFTVDPDRHTDTNVMPIYR